MPDRPSIDPVEVERLRQELGLDNSFSVRVEYVYEEGIYDLLVRHCINRVIRECAARDLPIVGTLEVLPLAPPPEGQFRPSRVDLSFKVDPERAAMAHEVMRETREFLRIPEPERQEA